MLRILFSLACTAIISISINFVKIIFREIIPSFGHIPKKRTALPCKILAKPTSAREAITHKQDMPAEKQSGGTVNCPAARLPFLHALPLRHRALPPRSAAAALCRWPPCCLSPCRGTALLRSFFEVFRSCINLVRIISEEAYNFPRKSAGKVSQNCHKVGMPPLFKAALT